MLNFHLSINLFYFLFFYKAFKILILFSHLCFWPHCTAYWILVPQPGIEPMPPALEGQSLTHWTTRKVAACISCAGCHREERGSRDHQAKFPLSGVPDPTPIASAPVTLSQPRMYDLCFWQNEMFNPLGMFRLVCAQSLSLVRLFVPLWTVAHQSPLTMDSPGKNTGVSCHFVLQGIIPTQGSNPRLLHCRRIVFYCWAIGEALRLVVLRIKKRIKTPNFYFFELGKRIIFYLFRKTCLICTKQWQETGYVVLTGGENPAVKLVEDCVWMCPALEHLLNTHVGQFCWSCASRFYHGWFHGTWEEARVWEARLLAGKLSEEAHSSRHSFSLFCQSSYSCDIHVASAWKMIISCSSVFLQISDLSPDRSNSWAFIHLCLQFAASCEEIPPNPLIRRKLDFSHTANFRSPHWLKK